MIRDSLIDPQSDTVTDRPGTQTDDADHGLPPAIHAYILRLGPGDDAALSELLLGHRAMWSQILADASHHMGLAAVQRAIAASQAAAGGGPSLRTISTARAYNQAHSHHVAVFNAATGNACVGADGELDPIAVWQWQKDHAIPHDGRVGPQTSSTARAAAAQTTATAPAPDADANANANANVEADADAEGIPAERMPDPLPPEAAPIAVDAAVDAEGIPAERMPDPLPAAAAPVAASADGIPAERTSPAAPAIQAPGPAAAEDIAAGGGATIDAAPAPTTAPAPPARPDNGGPGSLARRALDGQGTAEQAFQYLVSDNDATLDKNLADYGDIAAQRALLDGVIVQGADAGHVRRAFHAYWRVQLTGAGKGTNNVRDWPVPTLQAMHHELKVLPDQDSRAGVWNQLSLSDDPRMSHRGWYDATGNLSLGADARDATDSKQSTGYFEQLSAPARAGATQLQVLGGERFKVGDRISVDGKAASADVTTVTAVAGNLYTLGAALAHDHGARAIVDLHDGGGLRQTSWLDYTVRHEIAHFLDGNKVDTSGFYAMGGWGTFPSGSSGFESWLKAMGGEAAWATNDGGSVNHDDRRSIMSVISSALDSRSTGSLFDKYRDIHPPMPISTYEHKGVPAIEAAQRCLSLGESFSHNPTAMPSINGHRFSTSFMYGRFQYCSEQAVTDRVSDYSLSAPAEFFADTYAMFYEEAGKPGITDADHGRMIRNEQWRTWFREHVHNRGHGPAGTGAAKTDDAVAGQEPGARPGGANRGRSTGNPGG